MTPDLGLLGLLALTGLVLFGAVIPIVPTGATVSAAAVLARSERPWEVVLVIGFGALGAYLGDLLMYAILRAAGAPLAQRVGWLHAEDPDGALQRLRTGIEEHEVRSLLLSRLIPSMCMYRVSIERVVLDPDFISGLIDHVFLPAVGIRALDERVQQKEFSESDEQGED